MQIHVSCIKQNYLGAYDLAFNTDPTSWCNVAITEKMDVECAKEINNGNLWK